MASDNSAVHSFSSRFAVVGKYLKDFRSYIILGTVAVGISNVLILITPYIIKSIFELLERGATSSELLPRVLLLLGLSLISGGIGFATKRTFLWMGRRIEYGLRNDLLGHLIFLSPSFYRKNHTGDIMARMTSDIDMVRTMLGQGVLHAAETVLTILVAIPMMIHLSPLLTLYSLGPVVVLPVIINRLGNAIHNNFIPVQQQNAKITSHVQENLSGLRVVRAYRQEKAQVESFTDISREFVRLNMKLARLYGAFFPLTMFVASCLSLSAFYFGGMEVIGDKIPLGTLVAFFVYLGILFWPMFALGGLISMYQRGTVSLDRLNEFLSTEPDVKFSLEKETAKPFKGRIEFKNINFSYNDQQVLKEINLTIEAGQQVGIIGRTGSGKTTLVSLLPRLFPVDNGCIFIDGVDLNKWDPADLRRQISYATQEAFLFSDTIAENIQMGYPGKDMDAIECVSGITHLTEDIRSFESGFDTMVGERGVMLSGGQKQRVSIARALIRNPGILILDDVTSAVDTETEAKIFSRLKDVMVGRTTLIISQRISTIRNMDKIIFMEKGRIVEQGTHEDLIKKNGLYARMNRLQQLTEELDRA